MPAQRDRRSARTAVGVSSGLLGLFVAGGVALVASGKGELRGVIDDSSEPDYFLRTQAGIWMLTLSTAALVPWITIYGRKLHHHGKLGRDLSLVIVRPTLGGLALHW